MGKKIRQRKFHQVARPEADSDVGYGARYWHGGAKRGVNGARGERHVKGARGARSERGDECKSSLS